VEGKPLAFDPAKLAELREAKGWSQQALAERVGVGRTTVVAWEAGRAEPKGGSLLALAEALEVPPENLYLR